MLVIGWVRRGLLRLPGIVPRPLLASLDGWARAQARQRAERRRQRALQQGAQRR